MHAIMDADLPISQPDSAAFLSEALRMSDAIAPDVRDLLALNLVPGLGPRLTAALLRHFGIRGQRSSGPQRNNSASAEDRGQAQRGLCQLACQSRRRCRMRADRQVRRQTAGARPRRISRTARRDFRRTAHSVQARRADVPADRRAIAIVGSPGPRATASGSRSNFRTGFPGRLHDRLRSRPRHRCDRSRGGPQSGRANDRRAGWRACRRSIRRNTSSSRP